MKNNGIKYGWKDNQLYTKRALSSGSHIFTHKCNKLKSKLFQSLSNHHGAKYWIYTMLCTKFEKKLCIKNRLKTFWDWLAEFYSKIFLHYNIDILSPLFWKLKMHK